ncbi:unnamed protein product [Vitrella brassicaformis CCMP3155]|uniref:Uncharacterized protein n=1 Tax=Vitrella brassicaformis (strain CCMP3155) TaxID=1169540 RepID=A0A0G4FEB4_VITBC|nr:unnamed protein product [Vitrella brassicaformis CCMP3155]|mmetsp:Transcript_8890/g.21824  ORF Transcript_8890/g.21824 Transcript_8890/m.21824 type:complete len:188 (-) Transcript_8890:419-982(-)|eukprot:CEM11524.1 unnamed protein product [Vitrella brassicaformis CCMP3155]
MSGEATEEERVPPSGGEGTEERPQDQQDTEMTEPGEATEEPPVVEDSNGDATDTVQEGLGLGSDEPMPSHNGAPEGRGRWTKERVNMIGQALTGSTAAIKKKHAGVGGEGLTLYLVHQRDLSDLVCVDDDGEKNLDNREKDGYIYIATFGGVRVRRRGDDAPCEPLLIDVYVEIAGGRVREYLESTS